MTKPRALLSVLLLWASLVLTLAAQELPKVIVRSPSGVEWDANDTATITNGVTVIYGETVLTADKATINAKTGDIFAEGSVRIQQEDQTYVGEQLHYNYLTHQMDGERFRTGKAPLFASGEGLHGDVTNRTYIATNGMITMDDYYEPLQKVR